MSLKRTVASPLKQVLKIDEDLTSKLVTFIDKRLGPLAKYDGAMKVLEISCHGIPWFLGSTILMFVTTFKAMRQLCVNLFIGLLIDVIIVAVVKAATRRRRPHSLHRDMFGTYGVDKFSFPSGHASRAVMLYFLLSIKSQLLFFIDWLLLVWSVSVCVSRVLMRRHHVLDVAGGVLIGIVEGALISEMIWLSTDSSESLLHFFFR